MSSRAREARMNPEQPISSGAPPLPYYSSFKVFRRFFQGGLPVLTYHKLGPIPSGARLKALYLRRELFGKQLLELKNAGYQTGSLDNLRDLLQERSRIVLSFDDGFVNSLEQGLEPLAEHGFSAIQFVVAKMIGRTNDWDLKEGEASEPLMDLSQLRDWLAAGHQVGSHTLSHPWLTRIFPAAAREEIFASKKALEDRLGIPILHFCYPYGDWNEAVRDLVGEAGYLTASTTEAGVNQGGQDPLTLKRLPARCPSRSLPALLQRLRAWFTG
jgi:peptidoglycan/xylan/chitin deacetylase (PgdA/CDA1 family)